jgi:peptide deformylase
MEMVILKYPDPILFKVCKEVTVFGSELKILLDSMHETMVAQRGMGLSANQVGLTQRMFVMQTLDEDKLFVINPKITARSIAPANLKEGCLSAPGEFLTLPDRSSWVTLEFQNEKGEPQRRVFQAIFSVCVQHEIDHLDGKSHLQARSLGKKRRIELAHKWGFKVK